MIEQNIEELRAKVKQLATESLEKSQPYGWFETLYQQAEKDTNKVPWAKLKPHSELTDWLVARSAVESESAIVIGCGLGDDAEALQALGYLVTAFDISHTAIAWCRERFPDSAVNYQVADLFNLPEPWFSSADLVFECRNIQALPIDAKDSEGIALRSRAIGIISSLVKPGGELLIITRTRPDNSPTEGPPWGLSPAELEEFISSGLQEISDRSFAEDAEIPHIIRYFSKK